MRKLLTGAQVLLLLLFLCCAVYLGRYVYDLHHANSGYEELRKTVREKVDASGAYEEHYEDTTIDRAAVLAGINSDYIGWITIPDTAVDYPVVRTDDNEFYLKRDFYKNKSASGTPFADYNCTDESLNTIIYAHNMKDGSMFATLTRYTTKSFFNAHRRIVYDGEYEVFAVFRTNVGSNDEFPYPDYADLTDEDMYYEYVDSVLDRALWTSGDVPEYGDRLLTLSTCAYNTENERVVVVGYAKAHPPTQQGV